MSQSRVDYQGYREVEGTVASLQEMFEASLVAFWAIAMQLRLSLKEQAMLLAICESTCRRWRRKAPSVNVNTLDRLQLVLRTYASLSALAPVSDYERGCLLRAAGSAESASDPGLSLLAALSVQSILEMNEHCQRFESRLHAL